MNSGKHQRRVMIWIILVFNQLDLLINHNLFTSTQFTIVDNFNDKDEFKKLKIRLHAVLGKSEDEV